MEKMSIKTLKETDYYKKIREVINDLNDKGLLDRGVGYCVSMSDIVMKLLRKKGIECEMVECCVMVLVKNPPVMQLVGYEGLSHVSNFSTEMESHIVCVTKTPIPMLIDASLKNVDPNVPCVCIPIVKDNSNNIAEHDFVTSVWTYSKKDSVNLPWLHQKSILERIKTDEKFSTDITFLKKFIVVIIVLTSMNFLRGSFDFYQKYFVPNNNWGPQRVISST
jgi:hypothetical protein